MRKLVDITDLSKNEILDIFELADELQTGSNLSGRFQNYLGGKSVVLFFPNSSIRTRVTFEKGIYLLGGQPILFPSETLDKKEDLKDVCGYLNNWADAIIVRHPDIETVKKISEYSKVPVINAMTSVNHPCEIITDLYALSKLKRDVTKNKILFCGKAGNIGNTWYAASKILGFAFSQCCPKGYEIDGVTGCQDIHEAVVGKDIVCTDSLPKEVLKDFADYQVTREIMDLANRGALLNPCPPFYRGEEVSADVIDSSYFVGYEFKRHLLEVQQAILIYCLSR